MKKRLLFIVVVAVMVCGLTACACSKSNIEIAKEAKQLDYGKVSSELKENEAKAVDYNGQWYIFDGIVYDIKQNYCYMCTKVSVKGDFINPIEVDLSPDELKQLEKGQRLRVVGKYKYRGENSIYALEEAFVYPKDLNDDE